MNQRQPVQKRSRERMEQILLAAADQLAKTSNTDELTTTSVSKRSGVPVATIYRYFADRMAIITTLIDREIAELDAGIAADLNELESVSIQTLLDTIMGAHLRFFQNSRRSIVLWFGARHSSRVLARVDARYSTLGAWLLDGCINAGLVRSDAPKWGGESIVWLSDRVFEFIFREDRSAEEQQQIFDEFIEMMVTRLQHYATPTGIDGIPLHQFLEKAGPYAPMNSPAEVDQ
jgi:AcrR family transcriptional regulator